MTSDSYQEYFHTWEGFSLTIRWCPLWWCDNTHQTAKIGHLEIYSADKLPLPITEAGYKSHFIPPEVIEDAGGAIAYVQKWLEHGAKSRDWQQQRTSLQQPSLF